MEFEFYKYQGAGNDFVMIDQREKQWIKRAEIDRIAGICDRRLGIGADGLILLQEKAGYDFEMVYFNSDGRESTMCGNGGRCIAAFAHFLGIFEKKCRFLAIDGPHDAELHHAINEQSDWVKLHMQDVTAIHRRENGYELNTGSPHFVQFVSELDALDVFHAGRQIRQSNPYQAEGINVNFVCPTAAALAVRTYERGVEDETWSCGTGVVASVLAHHVQAQLPEGQIEQKVVTKGGAMEVQYRYFGGKFSDIWLCGPATRVFVGAF